MERLLDFTEEVREFLSQNLTEDLQRAGSMMVGIYSDQPVALRWHQMLNAKGWAVPTWPIEHGGTGWSLEQLAIFQQEMVLANAPAISPNATGMVGPVLIAFGTEEQKNHYLPRIRTGEDWWAQGYSEPGSGSDLASLQCRAVRDGVDYVINGTKIWTTHAQWSNKIFCLVRTGNDGKKQQGISFLLFDLDLPGIEVRPIISLSGDHELNQIFFNDVRVPLSGLLGKENDGWTVAKYLLQHERGGSYAPRLQTRLAIIKAFVRAQSTGRSNGLFGEAGFAQKLARVEIELMAEEAFERKLFAAVNRGHRNQGQSVGSLSSAIKIRGTELRQKISELALEVVDYYALPYQPQVRDESYNGQAIHSVEAACSMPRYLNDRAATIYGGSNEVQRNIIAKTVLGL